MAIEIYKIPLTNIPQRFLISLSGRSLTIENRYNAEARYWTISLFDGDTGDVIFTNMPLVTGTDLLRQYKHLGLVGKLFVLTDGDNNATPTEKSLGVDSNLYYLVDQP